MQHQAKTDKQQSNKPSSEMQNMFKEKQRKQAQNGNANQKEQH